MAAWQIHQYGGAEELTLNQASKAAAIKNPNEVKIKVHASSVNPIDVRMREGYGQKLINVLRKQKGFMKAGTEFPLVLGRDFSGTVVETGLRVKKFRVGDEVWGAVSAERPGTHAEITVVPQDEISKKPSNISHLEAASLPYVAMTTWAALCTVGQLRENNAPGKRILILGGSGGIGSFAIQMCRAWGMHVTTSCRPDAFDQVTSLGATQVFDYTDPSFWGSLHQEDKYHLILDTVGGESTAKATPLLKPCKVVNPLQNPSKLVTLNFDLLRNSDQHGIMPGLVKSAFSAGLDTLRGLQSGGSVRWAVFIANGNAMDKVRRMVESGKISPVVQDVFPFSEMPAAYQKVSDGHLRGKIVIDTYKESQT